MRLIPCLLAFVALSGAPLIALAAPAEEPQSAPPPPADVWEAPPAAAPEAPSATPPSATPSPGVPPPVPRLRNSPYPRNPPPATPPPPPYAYRRAPPPAYVYQPTPHYWWGWGWGWGYHGLLTPPSEGPGTPRVQAEPVYTRIDAYGAGMTHGYVAGVSFAVDGRWAGFDLSFDALAQDQVTGRLHDSGSDPAGWGAAHLTWSVVSTPYARLRVLTGASLLTLPDSRAVQGQPWAGNTLIGPDVGVSGQIGVAGPLGLEGYARVTPIPVTIVDTFGGLAIHGGPLGLTAGWRWVDVRGSATSRDAPKLWFRGPQVGLSLRF